MLPSSYSQCGYSGYFGKLLAVLSVRNQGFAWKTALQLNFNLDGQVRGVPSEIERTFLMERLLESYRIAMERLRLGQEDGGAPSSVPQEPQEDKAQDTLDTQDTQDTQDKH